MQRVQNYFVGQLQTIDESNQMVVTEPIFVELPPAITEPKPVTQHRCLVLYRHSQALPFL